MKALNDKEKEFTGIFLRHAQSVENYKDVTLLKEALEVIPEEELRIKATQKLSLIEGAEGDQCPSLEDIVLMELLRWFKQSFFSWVDSPKCDQCGAETQGRGTVEPLATESVWGAMKVEDFLCRTCVKRIRFPRYNHPRKLLQTRKGRCGEWANCFTLLCYAMGYDARVVFDWTDHVWTEVLSRDRNEWLHCDPCEDAFDKPLMYEKGWNKCFTYVIGFSTTSVQDVTWRYTTNYDSVRERRTLVREEYLEHLIWSYTKKLQESLTPEQQEQHVECTMDELISFLTPAIPENGASYEGRSSGSLAWRLARGEISSMGDGYVFKLFQEEIHEKHLLIKYSCALDKYIRVFDGRSVESKGWDSWANHHSNVFRKLEPDWKKVYLARTENSELGNLDWQFDFDGSELVVEKVKLSLSSRTFETGKVQWKLCWNSLENKPISIELDERNPCAIQTLKGCAGFTLSVSLTEGLGAAAWQHTQLFRQSLDSDAFPFQVEVFFTDKDDYIYRIKET